MLFPVLKYLPKPQNSLLRTLKRSVQDSLCMVNKLRLFNADSNEARSTCENGVRAGENNFRLGTDASQD